MQQPWIHKPSYDLLFILSPPFLILALIVSFPGYISNLENHYSFLTWLIFVVFIDVAHVYASIFKTYLVPEEFSKNKKLYIKIPLICLGISLILFVLGSRIFWTVLAYIAVFHFIRQQFGFMRLYARMEPKIKIKRIFDEIVIYNATIFPMLFWFLNEPRKFNWFMPGEFFHFHEPVLLKILTILYFGILILYIIVLISDSIRNKFINIPKNTIIFGTYLSWYFGIVYYNNELIFTMLNIVSHGIPYMALIYIKEVGNKPSRKFKWIGSLKAFPGLLIYIGILLILAFSEEFIWDLTVWNDWFSYEGLIPVLSQWQFLLVPLLALPQFTHYVLDGFIWKSPKKSQHLK